MTLEVAPEGMPLLSAVDADLSEGAVGLYTWFNAESAFDDVFVQDLDTAAVLLWDDFTHGDLTNWTVVDEGTWLAPSAWTVAAGALCQRSKIGSEGTDPADLVDYGTYALYMR